MTEELDNDGGPYRRIALITSKHPTKPLQGTAVTISTSAEIDIGSPKFEFLLDEAREQFDVSSYATELRLGTVFLDAGSNEVIGVAWESSPRPYDHDDLDDTVKTLPDSFSPVNLGD
jgi:hypothetical protein